MLPSRLTATSFRWTCSTVLATWTWRLVQPTSGVAIAAPLPELPKPADPAPDVPQEADPTRFSQVPVVLRVRLLREGPAKNHGFDEVEILHVLKNTPQVDFGKTLHVAKLTIQGKSGVPAGISTIYLEPFGDRKHWQLFKGGAPDGVSHVAAQVHKHGPGH
jgi:hypothetical protein